MREIKNYQTTAEMCASYRTVLKQEEEARTRLLQNEQEAIARAPIIGSAEKNALPLDNDLNKAKLGASFLDIRIAQKIYTQCDTKPLIIVCAGLVHVSDGSTLATLLKKLGFAPCFKQGVSCEKKSYELTEQDKVNLPPLSWQDIGSLIARNGLTCLCCPCGTLQSISMQILQKKINTAALDIEQTFAQFMQQEEQTKRETSPAPLLAHATQQEAASTLRKR